MKRINLDPIVECALTDLKKHLIRYEVDANGKIVLSKLTATGVLTYLTYTSQDIDDAVTKALENAASEEEAEALVDVTE